MRARILALGAVALASAGLTPSLARADTLLIKVSEVYAGTGPGPDGDFVELQMYAPGQNIVTAHYVKVYDASGNQVPPNAVFMSPVPNGGSQRTILIGNPTPPGSMQPDLEDTALDIPAAGGAVCFGDTSPFDCASWGSFTAQSVLADPQSSNAPAITSGSSLTRSIAPGCPSLLEDSDDTGSSQTDFAVATPSPRNNSTTPTETACEPPPDPGPGPDLIPPNTTITKAPDRRSERDSARFTFASNEAGSLFECSRDGKPFRSCISPTRYRKLDDGRHRFQVRAIDPTGNVDPSPAKARWKVVG